MVDLFDRHDSHHNRSDTNVTNQIWEPKRTVVWNFHAIPRQLEPMRLKDVGCDGTGPFSRRYIWSHGSWNGGTYLSEVFVPLWQREMKWHWGQSNKSACSFPSSHNAFQPCSIFLYKIGTFYSKNSESEASALYLNKLLLPNNVLIEIEPHKLE